MKTWIQHGVAALSPVLAHRHLIERAVSFIERNAAAIGLINLIRDRSRYGQIARLKLLPRIAA
jgi:hypothetical protein